MKGETAGQKSYAIGLTFRDDTKTLTDKEVEASVNRVIKALEKKQEPPYAAHERDHRQPEIHTCQCRPAAQAAAGQPSGNRFAEEPTGHQVHK